MIDKTKQDFSHRLYLNGITISREEEMELFHKYHEETDQTKKDKIKDRLIRANMRFAISESMKLTRSISASKTEDIIAEALLGLSIAIDKYDHTREIKFISYAVWHIKQKVFAFLNKDDLIQLPPVKKSETLKLLGSGDSSKFEDEEMVNLYNVLQNIVSVDAKVGHSDDSDDVLGDTIPDNTMIDDLESNKKQMILSTILRDAIDRFMPNEQIIIQDMMLGESIQVSADRLHISRQRVAMIKRSIVRKLKLIIEKNDSFKSHRRELMEH